MKRRDLNTYDLWKTKVRRVGLKKFKLDAPLLFENDFHLAERERFELSEPLPARRFSRPFPSTTRAPLRTMNCFGAGFAIDDSRPFPIASLCFAPPLAYCLVCKQPDNFTALCQPLGHLSV